MLAPVCIAGGLAETRGAGPAAIHELPDLDPGIAEGRSFAPAEAPR